MLQLSFAFTITKFRVNGTPVCPSVTSLRSNGLVSSPPTYGYGPSTSVAVTMQLPLVDVVEVLVLVVPVVVVLSLVTVSFLQPSIIIGPAAAIKANVLKKFLRSMLHQLGISEILN